jgi:phenol 2-monooxygenase
VATRYTPTTALTAEPVHQSLATGFPIGMRFHSAPVIRVVDAKPMHLGHAARADGAWRIYAFADANGERLRELTEFLAHSPNSPLMRFTPKQARVDSVISLLAVYQQAHRDIDVGAIPTVLLPRKGKFDLIDYEQVFAPDLKTPSNDIFDLRGINRQQGALVVVRPDQYVANVLPLDAHEALSGFFAQFLMDI